MKLFHTVVNDEIEQFNDDLIRETYFKNLKGNGLLGDVWQNVNNSLSQRFGSNNWRKTPDIRGTEYEKSGPEIHYPGMNFMGPGTKINLRILRGDRPVNFSDKCAMEHDIAYGKISNRIKNNDITKEEVYLLVREADNELLKCLNTDPSYLKSAILQNFVSYKIIEAKKKLEDLGLLDTSKFVSSKPIEVQQEIKAPPGVTIEEIKKPDGSGIKINNDIILHKIDDNDEDNVEYECCESCFKGKKICEKKPGYLLKTMFIKNKK